MDVQVLPGGTRRWWSRPVGSQDLHALDWTTIDPVRSTPSHSKMKHKPGWVWLDSTCGLVRCESRNEMACLLRLDFEHRGRYSVIRHQPLALTDGSPPRLLHVPDFLLWPESERDRPVLMDVTLRHRLGSESSRRKMAASQRLSDFMGWGYRVEVELSEAYWANLRLLARYRRGWKDLGHLVPAVIGACAEPRPFRAVAADVARSLDCEEEGVRAAMLHLLWRRDLHANVSTDVLSNHTPVQAGEPDAG